MKFPGMWLINPYSTDVWNMTRTGNLSMEFLKAPHRFSPHDAAVIEILGIILTSVTRSFCANHDVIFFAEKKKNTQELSVSP